MSWHTDNALKRIVNVFKRSKEKVYKEDITALQLLNDELVNSQKKYVTDNILFAKLLSHVLINDLKHYGSMKMAIKNIDGILKTPLDNQIEFLRLELNNKDFVEYMESLGIEMNHLDHKENKNNIILKENQKEVKEKLLKFWDYEKISKSFYNTANEFLKDITNYN